MAVALIGKHPGVGDFITAGTLSPDLMRGILDWLAATLGNWREGTGPAWEVAFDAAPALMFWVGPEHAAGQSLRGAMIPSRDRTGRRFPLMLVQSPAGPGPFARHDPGFDQAASAELARLAGMPTLDARAEVEAIAAVLPRPGEDDGAPVSTTFWALNPTLGPGELMADLAMTEAHHAQAGRSVWWFAAEGQPTGLLSCANWPEAVQMGWLLSGGRMVPAAGATSSPEVA